MRLLHVISSVDPATGGPVESVRRGGLEMLRRGHAVEVVSLDRPDPALAEALQLPLHSLGPATGNYGYTRRLVPWLRAHATRFDAAVVNGLWQYPGFAVRRALGGRIPYFVFPHGMLDPWFAHTYPLKHLKKWAYWPWAEYRVLRDAAAVLFTCEEEKLLARRSFALYRVNEAVVAFGTAPPPADRERLLAAFFGAHPTLRGSRLLLFLGRLHRKKGCDLLVDAFAAVARDAVNLHLVMAGPDQEGWRGRLEARAAALGVAQRITWTGMIGGDMKWGALYGADALVLPSHQENFGIAVAEALGCGVPVLVSDRVNIWREIVAAEAGLAAPDTLAGTTDLLRRWLATPVAGRDAMRRAALGCFDRHFTAAAMADSLEASIAPHLPRVPAPDATPPLH